MIHEHFFSQDRESSFTSISSVSLGDQQCIAIKGARCDTCIIVISLFRGIYSLDVLEIAISYPVYVK